MTDANPVLWSPSDPFIENSNLTKFMQWLEANRSLNFDNYYDLWEWSISESEAFWQSIVDYFDVKFYNKPGRVLSQKSMPGAKWFEGATLNYAEHLFRHHNGQEAALISVNEQGDVQHLSWNELEKKVASFIAFLRSRGVGKGDRVVAYLPNISEATIAFIATCSIGAIWSSCSPDFGASSVIDRFQQIEPAVFIGVDGYTYNGKIHEKRSTVRDMLEHLPTVNTVVWVRYLDTAQPRPDEFVFDEISSQFDGPLEFEPVDFSHPIWVLYSSGTTGKPKAITHSQGGVLLEHLKYLAFHNDVKAGERFFWFSTTGWMMWNFVQASLLMGATIILYEGSPAHPSLKTLWKMAANLKIEHFGTSAPFIVACMKRGIKPGEEFDLSHLRSISSTGAPLPPEAFKYIYKDIKKDLWLCSMSGGTDVCTAFVGGCPIRPVRLGEIQCRALGCDLDAWDTNRDSLRNEVGEMVIKAPMPSMPIYFWNDTNDERYLSSYFEDYPGIWRHGDWVKITEHDGLVIYGRSDATLNRHGVRIGTSEIYRSLNKIPELQDGLIVNIEKSDGDHYMPLFVLVKSGNVLDEDLKSKIKKQLRSDYSPRHVPDEIIACPEIPLTISGKKMEAPVKRILMNVPVEKAANADSMRNPDSLQFFVDFAKDKMS